MAEIYNIRIVVEQQEGQRPSGNQNGFTCIAYDVIPEACIPTIFLSYDIQRQHYDVIEEVKPK
ncbi:OTU family cysteine protease [Toxoplasma gondii GAB2-2007-GAL-DOM2]|uniref:OTU family cysteine protease n=6 Tax=Toxoplasma gondii TaxID=5811 RepID=S7V2V2_TOXGG|nr:OTU family cysteine protease [Toxoplasma gondii GT1]KFG48324.1 OTU family cysteine protease [Toxoplasma gondii GAB2-2007-GAL-DOM2]KFG55483.1 OTU family cysteine protease [Toxoplasma gondii FOU]KFH10990.1 OTU family cysteine protease [Toxoplasma gondii VAND]PUA92817.1 OTU family cysteine protease [Toxoplasma gondii TgCATBr9]RQX74829.1 OTU family cysteine protease [Toxoplasma gondii CAST]